MASTADQLRLQAKRISVAQKKKATDHAKGKKFSGPKPRRLRIRA